MALVDDVNDGKFVTAIELFAGAGGDAAISASSKGDSERVQAALDSAESFIDSHLSLDYELTLGDPSLYPLALKTLVLRAFKYSLNSMGADTLASEGTLAEFEVLKAEIEKIKSGNSAITGLVRTGAKGTDSAVGHSAPEYTRAAQLGGLDGWRMDRDRVLSPHATATGARGPLELGAPLRNFDNQGF